MNFISVVESSFSFFFLEWMSFLKGFGVQRNANRAIIIVSLVKMADILPIASPIQIPLDSS